MNLNTDHLCRCIQTLESSLGMLQKSDQTTVEYEIYRNAVVKGFELALETSGKLLRKALKEFTGAPGSIDDLPYKEVLRSALKHGLLNSPETVQRWFTYRDNRNSTAHDYGIGFANETLVLMPDFILDVRTLEATLREKFSRA